MNVLYEESGDFKVGTILADNNTSFQIETQHGKRSKVKANAVMFQFQDPLHNFLPEAQKISDEIDIDFLWQCSSDDEFNFDALAKEYFGRPPQPQELAGILLRLHNAPIYFYKKGKGRYRAAPEESLKAALLSVEKKRLLALKQQAYVEQLKNFSLPEEFKSIANQLLYNPDKNSTEFKALTQACEETNLSAPKLFQACGVISSEHDYHFNRFLFEIFRGTLDFGMVDEINYPNYLPIASVKAFSIDSSFTTEIDDAFSVEQLTNGNWRIGIHIAVPAIAIPVNSKLDYIAQQRLSTVYIPGQKITMLPETVIQQFSLNEGKTVPVISLYFEANSEYIVLNTKTQVEQVTIATNLRYDLLELEFDLTDLNNAGEIPYKEELKLLFNIATHLESLRGKSEVNYIDYDFHVIDDRISITERKRGSALDKIVSELMIFTNSNWAELLSDKTITAIYRTQNEGKVKMSLIPEPHEGIGVEQYAWTTSPLRRYIDFINQRQLLALVNNEAPPYRADDELLTSIKQNFEIVYDQYDEFQKTMERYWCLRWLLQEGVIETRAVVIKENLVRIENLPLYTRIHPLPEIAPGNYIKIEVSAVDLLGLNLNCRFKELAEEI